MPASISDVPSRVDTPATIHPHPDTSLIGNLALNPSSTSALRELISIEENDLSAARASLVPALSAVSAAKSRVSALQEELASGQFTLKLAQQTADRIQRRISDLEKSLKERRGFLHPIRRLPVEVLREVFIWRIEEEESARRNAVDVASKLVDSGLRGPMSPAPGYWIEFCPVAAALVLTAVCKHWREVAHATPRLWKYIYGSLSGQPLPSHHDVWRACQTRVSGLGGIDRPLELVLEGWEDGNHPAPVHRIECMMNVLIGHALGLHKAATAGEKSTSLMARDMVAPDGSLGVTTADKRSSFTIRRMEISFRRATRAQFGEPRQWSASYPVPQELVLINRNGKGSTEVPPYCFSLFTQVTKLALNGMRNSWPSGVNYSNLKSLSLDAISAQDLNACLQACKDHLMELELRDVGFGLENLGPMTTLSKLENCTMGLQVMVEYCSALSMPALKKLTLLDLSARRQNLLRVVQQYVDLRMPSVVELRVCAGRLSITATSHGDYIASMVAPAMDLPPEPPANLVGILSAFTNLVTLHLEVPAVRPVLEAWASLPSEGHNKLWLKLEALILEGELCPLNVEFLQSAGSKRNNLVGEGASGSVDSNSASFTVNSIPFGDFIEASHRRGRSH
jgi:hypothetical protein